MVLVGPLLWWAGVVETTAGAYAATPPEAGERVFIENYDGPGRQFAVIFGGLNLLLLGVFMPTARQLADRRVGTRVRAAVTAVVAGLLAYGEHLANPVTANWGGDPDGWSMVQDHVPAWAVRLSTGWLVLTLLTAAGIAVWAVVTAARRP